MIISMGALINLQVKDSMHLNEKLWIRENIWKTIQYKCSYKCSMGLNTQNYIGMPQLLKLWFNLIS